jgi:YD repeat-containing protein
VRLPASPNAAALERYALMPVNEAAGTPTISLPLYEVRSGALTLPLTLSYHASGIRVGDQASWVGLGWALNAGGVITRQVRGLPDEHPRGFSTHYKDVPNRDTITCEKDETLLDEIVASRVDYQPDLYNYNFQGQAGSFMRDNKGQFRCLPLQPVRIEQVDSAFLLTDAHGVSYRFAHREISRSNGRPPASISYTSAWFLSRIVSADKADTIRFIYTPYALYSKSVQQQHTLISNIGRDLNSLASPPVETFTETITNTNQQSFRLQRIVFRAGEVIFQATTRADIPADKRLASVTVLAGRQDTLRQLQLHHSYFSGEPRLRLDSLTTRSGQLRLPPHVFTYNSLPLPGRLFGSRDHWGYYNGATPAPSFSTTPVSSPQGTIPSANLIPRLRINHYSGLMTYPGADRAPNPAYVQAAILTDITFPTGGTQHFTYEPNLVAEQYLLPPTPIPSTPITLETNGPGPISRATGVCVSAQENLTVTHDTTLIRFTITGQQFDTIRDFHNKVTLFIYDLANPQRVLRTIVKEFTPSLSLYINSSDSLILDKGQYKFELKACGNTSATSTLSPYYLRLPPGLRSGWRNTLVGGVRLREQRIQATRQGPATIKIYRYNIPKTGLSSGYLISDAMPLYDRYHTARVPANRNCGACDSQYDPPPPPPIDITYVTLSSSSLSELNGGDRPVGYRYVTVTDSATAGVTNGYTVSAYAGVPDNQGGWKPARPLVSNAWQRDQLLEQRIYFNQPSGVAALLTFVKNEYVFRDTLEIKGFCVSTDATIQYGITINKPQPDIFPFVFENSRQTSGYQYLRQTRQYQYAPGDTTAYHLTTTTYRYDNPRHQQPTLVETDLANGQHQQVRTRYVADYDGTQFTSQGPARAIRELQQLHAPAQVVEQTTTRTTPTDTLVTQSKLTLSRVVAPGVVVTDRELRYKTATPSRWRTFAPAALRAGQLTVASGYETQLVCDAYTPQRALAQAHEPSGLPLSYLWDTRAQQPLAQVKNATLAQVAVTSFEPQAAGRWAYDTHLGSGQHLAAAGRTGNWAYQLTSGWPISRDSLPAGDYELTCWYQGGPAPLVLGSSSTPVGTLQPLGTPTGAWQPARARVHLATAGRVQLSASAGTAVLLDDLCLYPVGAQLTTYTYDALRGVTSQTGPDGRTQTYEYDGLGRLVRTRDERGRILGQQQYHYAGQ